MYVITLWEEMQSGDPRITHILRLLMRPQFTITYILSDALLTSQTESARNGKRKKRKKKKGYF